MAVLARNHPVRSYAAGEAVFRSGEPGETMFGVIAGTVRIQWDGISQTETFGPGESFGIGALVEPQHRRHGTATALTETKLVVLGRDRFLFAIQETPLFGLEMLAALEQRLRELKGRRLP
jgi:CRP-like cAMP-binding protein